MYKKRMASNVRAEWLARPQNRRFDRTVFRHPVTRRRLEYSVSHRLDPARQALHVRFHYQPLDDAGIPVGRARTVRLCHRQLSPDDVDRLARDAKLRVLSRWGGFSGEPVEAGTETEQHVYLLGKRP